MVVLIGQQVSGDLLVDEAVERLVGVECCDDVVPIAPGVADQHVALDVGEVGVAGEIEPVPRPVVAEGRRGQEAIDHLLVGIGGSVIG